MEVFMARHRSGPLLIVLIGSILLAHATHASDQVSDEVIKNFLKSHETEQEGTQSQGSAVADLNGDGKPEIVLVWTLLGPTYWNNTLTVFSQAPEGYKEVASLPLNGEAVLFSVKGGFIAVDQKLFAKNDPLCCPSINKRIKYRWQGKKLLEIKKK
jgi:hypothetical protein